MSYTRNADFVRIHKGGHGQKYMTHAVTMAINTDNTPKNNKQRISVRIVVDTLNELGWKVGDYIELHEGTGKSAGKLLLITSSNGAENGYKLSDTSAYISGMRKNKSHRPRDVTAGYFAFQTTKLTHHSTPMQSMPAEPVKYRVFNNELLIDMPSWCKPRTTSRGNGE